MVVSVLDTLTSIVAGLVIFSILGAMAYESGDDISTVVSSGPGLAFVAYPEALTRLPCPQLWSFFFFFMLFVLGLDSEFALLENVITSALDEFPRLRRHCTWFCVGLASICYLIGLTCMTRGGHYVFEMMDTYGGNAGLFFVAVMEIVAIAWLYGTREFCYDIEFMLKRPIGYYWKVTWAISAPVVLIFIFVYWLCQLELMSVRSEYTWWTDVVGWVLTWAIMVQVPGWAVWAVMQQPGSSLAEKIRGALKPGESWGPGPTELQEEWKTYKAERRGLKHVSTTRPQLRKVTPLPTDLPGSDKKYAFDNLTFEDTIPSSEFSTSLRLGSFHPRTPT